MTIYSDEIKDFLDKIYFYELTHRDDITSPLYNYYEEKLHNIDKLPTHHPSTTFPMSRDGLFGLTIGRLEFGYEFDGTNASVEYYVNREPQNDWFDWLIGENKERKDRIIKEVINQYLKENVITEIAIPKSHQRLIDKYCSHRQLRGYHQDDMNRYNSQLEEYNKEYQNFLQTGTVSHEFLKKLLGSYKNIVDMLVGTSKGNYSHYSDCDELERELQSKGYNTEELYNDYISRQ